MLLKSSPGAVKKLKLINLLHRRISKNCTLMEIRGAVFSFSRNIKAPAADIHQTAGAECYDFALFNSMGGLIKT